jgi:hypothetical protein
MSCLFGAAGAELMAALGAAPDCDGRLYRFTFCPGLTLSGDALAVVRLGGNLTPPWTPVPERWLAEPPPSEPLARALARHGFLLEALPPPEACARLAEIARAAGRPLWWWWWWERGDDLYADAAWCCGPEGELVAARATALATGDDDERVHVYAAGAPDATTARAPLQVVMDALGFASEHQYFVPMDSWHFDWSPFRA